MGTVIGNVLSKKGVQAFGMYMPRINWTPWREGVQVNATTVKVVNLDQFLLGTADPDTTGGLCRAGYLRRADRRPGALAVKRDGRRDRTAGHPPHSGPHSQ